MRSAFVAIAPLALAAFSAPAAAQDTPEDALDRAQEQVESFGDVLRDPGTQDMVADTLGTVLAAMLDMPAAPFVEAAARARGEPVGVDPDTTLGELAGADAGLAPERLAAELPQAMERMGDMSESLSAMMPALAELAQRMGEISDRAARR